MTETTPVNVVLGLTDAEYNELLDDIKKNTNKSDTFMDVLLRLKETYDVKAMLVGIQVMQLMNINEKIYRERKAKEQVFNEIFGPQQNAEMN